MTTEPFDLAWIILKGSKRPGFKFNKKKLAPKLQAIVDSAPVPDELEPEDPDKPISEMTDEEFQIATTMALDLNRAKGKAKNTQDEVAQENFREEMCPKCGKISEPSAEGHEIRPYVGNELCDCPGGALDRMKDENQHLEDALPFQLEDE